MSLRDLPFRRVIVAGSLNADTTLLMARLSDRLAGMPKVIVTADPLDCSSAGSIQYAQHPLRSRAVKPDDNRSLSN